MVYQAILEDTDEKLRDLKRHNASSRKEIRSDLDLQIELNQKLEESINKLREKNNLLDVRYSGYKERANSEKSEMLDTIKDLKERNSNLMKNLKLQMTSTTKIDNARQKLSDRCKELQREKDELAAENEEYVNTINELRQRLDTMKSGSEGHGDRESRDNFRMEKTKGTFSDKDDSHNFAHGNAGF